jgi:hypothetical protein
LFTGKPHVPSLGDIVIRFGQSDSGNRSVRMESLQNPGAKISNEFRGIAKLGSHAQQQL